MNGTSRRKWVIRFMLCSFFITLYIGYEVPSNPLLHQQDVMRTLAAGNLPLYEDDGLGAAPAYIPPPTTQLGLEKKQSPAHVKGIYVSAWNMSGAAFDRLLRLVETTELNAMVIDVKNDLGQVTYPSKVPEVNEIGSNARGIIPDLSEKIALLKQKNIYTIARLVVFKDPFLAAKKPEYAIRRMNGEIWNDAKNIAWVDPYQENVWAYNLAIAKEVEAMGMDEVQFDYVRFPDQAGMSQEVQFSMSHGRTKAEAIEQFLIRGKRELHHAAVSADVFGLTTSSHNDMGIGQLWDKISGSVDVISPMIYPSHYSKGMYNIENPDLSPYATVSRALEDGLKKNATLASGNRSPAAIRPWLQSFTATWVHPHLIYGSNEVMEQIKAVKERGIEQYLLWNPTGKYTF